MRKVSVHGVQIEVPQCIPCREGARWMWRMMEKLRVMEAAE
jgi:NADH:ubiquinone oxidoreductase subunit F (NADH-binding)